MKKLILILSLVILSCSVQKNNYDIKLKELDAANQLKLDTGKSMLKTEREYVIKLDSLMKVIYGDLIESKNIDKENLKNQQNEWRLGNELKVRDIWKKLEESNNSENIPREAKLNAYGNEAKLTRNRILELINKFND